MAGRLATGVLSSVRRLSGNTFGRTFEASRYEAGDQRSGRRNDRKGVAINRSQYGIGRQSDCTNTAGSAGIAKSAFMLGVCRNARGFGCGYCRGACSAIAFVVMPLCLHDHFKRTMVCHRTARGLDSRSKPLKGQRGEQQPEHKCLEDASHFVSIPFRSASLSRRPVHRIGLPTMGRSSEYSAGYRQSCAPCRAMAHRAETYIVVHDNSLLGRKNARQRSFNIVHSSRISLRRFKDAKSMTNLPV